MAALTRQKKPLSPPAHTQQRRWFEALMAIIALTNFTLVVVDLSYVRFRDLYLRFLPEFTAWYGETFKGMEPERATMLYLATVDRLEEQVAQTGLQSPEAESLLAELRTQSEEMIDENPFQVANKSGVLEQIKQLMRDRVGSDSAKEAFNIFWSRPYYLKNLWADEIAFFNAAIEPRMETNYFRGIGFDGAPIDWFWKIDTWFIGLFGVELLARSFYISRRYKNFTWIDAVLTRWYDLLLVMPFSAMRLPSLSLLRILPLAVRLDKSRLVDLEPVANRINRFLISQVAIELTEVVILRIIDQAQTLLRNGDLASWLLAVGSGRRYIDINGVNEIQVISQHVTGVVVDQVLPQLKPEIDAILSHSVDQALNQTPGYQGFRQIPGLGSVPQQVSQQLVAQISESFYKAIKAALEDEQGAALMQSLITKFGDTLRSEAQQAESLEDIQALTITLLEEIKINYVKQVAAEDWDSLEEKRYRLYDVTQEAERR